MRAGVRDYSVSDPFYRSGESLRVLLFNFHKINQAKKKTGKDFPDAFPAGNAALLFLPEPCVPDIRGARQDVPLSRKGGGGALFMVKGMDLLVCRKHAV